MNTVKMKTNLAVTLVCLFALFLSSKSEFSEVNEYQKYYDHLDNIRYNVNIPPKANGGYGFPIEVYSTMYIIDIYKVDTHSKDYEVSFYFRQRWNDTRLAYHDLDMNKPIIIRDPSQIWTPDLFFVREKSGNLHQIVHPNTFIRIDPNGEVHYSNKYTMTFSCPMNFRSYPEDVQICSFSAESYGFTMDRLNLFWEKRDGHEPVQYNREIDVFPYKVSSVNHTENIAIFKERKYKNLEVQIIFERSSDSFETDLYIPSAAFVVLSWLSFWMPNKLRFLRLALILVTLYLMVLVGRDAKKSEPGVPYLTGIDVWVGACNFFVFAAFLEFILMSMLKMAFLKTNKMDCSPDGPVLVHTERDSKSTNPVAIGSAINVIASRLRGTEEIHKRVDKASRIIFPVLFLIFCFIYFIIY